MDIKKILIKDLKEIERDAKSKLERDNDFVELTLIPSHGFEKQLDVEIIKTVKEKHEQ